MMKQTIKILGLFFTLLIGFNTVAQNFKHTLTIAKEANSPKATLKDVSWISGHWRGKMWGGDTEEVWTPPLGNSMMCVFKYVKNEVVQFYEIVAIIEENNTLIMQLKHFNGSLKGWEQKDETVDFKLVKVEKNKVFFDGFTFELVDKNSLNIYVVIENKGTKEETKFSYKRF